MLYLESYVVLLDQLTATDHDPDGNMDGCNPTGGHDYDSLTTGHIRINCGLGTWRGDRGYLYPTPYAVSSN